jgi:hypothetical protein
VFEAWHEQTLQEKIVRSMVLQRIFRGWKKLYKAESVYAPYAIRDTRLRTTCFKGWAQIASLKRRFYFSIEKRIYRIYRSVYWAFLENILRQQKKRNDIELAEEKSARTLCQKAFDSWTEEHRLKGRLAYAESWYRNRNRNTRDTQTLH